MPKVTCDLVNNIHAYEFYIFSRLSINKFLKNKNISSCIYKHETNLKFAFLVLNDRIRFDIYTKRADWAMIEQFLLGGSHGGRMEGKNRQLASFFFLFFSFSSIYPRNHHNMNFSCGQLH